MRFGILGIFVLTYSASAGVEETVGQLLNPSLSSAQRNDACYALKDDRSAEVNTAMRRVMSSDILRACAARHLREAGAVAELKEALQEEDADIKVAALREMGILRDPALIPVIADAGLDLNALVATNAVDALAQYGDRQVLPALIRIAQAGKMAGATALARAARFADPSVVQMARQYLAGDDVAAQVIAIRVLGDLGDRSDLPRLRPIAAHAEALPSQGRGFGMMPSIDLGKVAKNAIQQITSRGD
ncbi:MAG: HEAT repeat domain-containing protein [Bryobacteraceae bacterium]|nr:HEAT repeat domain-containing protein [Bryobacteraceae bacterium]